MAKLLPLILVLIGVACGSAAGFFLRPSPELHAGSEDSETDSHGSSDHAAPSTGHGAASGGHGASEEEGVTFLKLNNQFVIPIVHGGRVAALVVLSLSLEVGPGGREQVYGLEPKIRDALLTVMFEHANMGRFDGNFTAARNIDVLRRSLTEAAREVMSSDIVSNVLVLDMVRQDVG